MNYFLAILTTVFILTSCKNDKKNKTTTVKTETTKEQNTSIKNVDTSKMVLFKGGSITIGANDRTELEAPAFETNVQPFYLDINLVSVADFRKFVEATNYTTEAENFGDSGVFDFENIGWNLVKEVTWEYPFGVHGEKAKNNHPVTHVSWNDAVAFANWAGKRLPTELEWEFAAKNGKNLKYPWGNSVTKENKIMANTWDGKTIQDQTVKDGYLFTSPVASFPKSNSGIHDMVGNVWQWTSTIFAPYDKNIPFQKNTNVVVTRGGSFMYDQALELSFTTTFRAQNTKESSLFNTGFRCAKSAN
ncbi:sulfatase modifying factor 1 [Wenyingzhuangia heitensis]|uniref:Sulfatase modifying factor 1 n=1 Tax=Wenyingzhuangia heitensis TaxID=1487859 RepID=A0ABX0U4W4_9FLAO|nr:formylglycine-generating enzyme family protein [Wenyingzhuangia heitensis]NIJ43842.1 sulfatase modifying factor 1 [Wenyingzhuangia heitensis]